MLDRMRRARNSEGYVGARLVPLPSPLMDPLSTEPPPLDVESLGWSLVKAKNSHVEHGDVLVPKNELSFELIDRSLDMAQRFGHRQQKCRVNLYEAKFQSKITNLPDLEIWVVSVLDDPARDSDVQLVQHASDEFVEPPRRPSIRSSRSSRRKNLIVRCRTIGP